MTYLDDFNLLERNMDITNLPMTLFMMSVPFCAYTEQDVPGFMPMMILGAFIYNKLLSYKTFRQSDDEILLEIQNKGIATAALLGISSFIIFLNQNYQTNLAMPLFGMFFGYYSAREVDYYYEVQAPQERSETRANKISNHKKLK